METPTITIGNRTDNSHDALHWAVRQAAKGMRDVLIVLYYSVSADVFFAMARTRPEVKSVSYVNGRVVFANGTVAHVVSRYHIGKIRGCRYDAAWVSGEIDGAGTEMPLIRASMAPEVRYVEPETPNHPPDNAPTVADDADRAAFNAVWDVIRGWDVVRSVNRDGKDFRTKANGDDVRTILNAIRDSGGYPVTSLETPNKS